MEEKPDEYQARYLRHQQFGKKQELIALMKERHSNRRFGDEPVTREQIDEIIESTKDCPSSCDRHGVRIRVVTERNEKDLLDGLLVGGTGWVYRAPVVLLLLADPQAYKADGGNEINYNSYLDAGAMVQQMSLVATAMGLHCAFVNPNIREENREFFYDRFTPGQWDEAVFCGAFVFGPPHPEPIEKTRNYEYDPEVRPLSPQERIAKAESRMVDEGQALLNAAKKRIGEPVYAAGLPEKTIPLLPGLQQTIDGLLSQIPVEKFERVYLETALDQSDEAAPGWNAGIMFKEGESPFVDGNEFYSCWGPTPFIATQRLLEDLMKGETGWKSES